MKKQAILTILVVFMIGLITACSKKDDTPATPISPIVGQWDISRFTRSGLSAPYTTGNQSYTSNLGTDSYIFKSDGTYSDVYDNNNNTTSTENGAWLFATPVVTLTPIVQAGQPSGSYTLNYTASTNELTTGTLAVSDSLTNPTTNKNELVKYNIEIVYKKKQ